LCWLGALFGTPELAFARIVSIPAAGVPVPAPGTVVTAHFEVGNGEDSSKRAWIRIEATRVSLHRSRQPSESDYASFNLAGLAYDPIAREVIYDPRGKPVVCATVAERRIFLFFKTLEVTPTGNCELRIEPGVAREQTVAPAAAAQLVLEIREPGHAAVAKESQPR
jgi:hypothetical protein